MGKKVSIIVPVYNSKKYLKKCIDSILSQSYKEFELLLINDGSTDCSRDICKSYDDKRIKYLEQKNEGVSSARNKGIKESTGDFITFVDSDDSLSEDYLSVLVILQDEKKSDWTACPYSYVNLTEKPFKGIKPEWDNDISIKGRRGTRALREKILYNGKGRRTLASPCCKLYRSDIIKNNNLLFDPLLKIGEDAIFNLQYSEFITSFSYKKEFMYYRTVREDSAVMKYRPEAFKELTNLFSAYTNIKKKFGTGFKNEKIFVFNSVNNLLGSYLFHKDNFESVFKRTDNMYRFLSQRGVSKLWKRIDIKDLKDSKDKIKLVLFKYHLLLFWIMSKKIMKNI